MVIAGLLEGVRSHGHALLSSIAANIWIIAAVVVLAASVVAFRFIMRSRQRRKALARDARADWVAHGLKEKVRERLTEAGVSLGPAIDDAPTLGAWELLSADIDAAAKTVLLDAGGRRGKAKHMLRQRLLNGSGGEPSVWRQLGALSLLDSASEAFNAYSRAAELAPDDPQVQMLVGVTALRTGHLERAEATFQRLLQVNSDTGVAARHRARTMLGDVLLAKGDQDAALAAYEEAYAEANARAELEPDTPAWQRDISFAHDRVGDLRLARGEIDAALEHYRTSLGLAEKLVARDPERRDWRRDLSVAHDRVGEALQRKGDLEGALARYRSGLALAEALAREDADRAAWRWDISASLDRIGDILLAQGKAQDALATYRRGLQIAEAAIEDEPGRTAWERDLAVSYHKVGTLEATDGSSADAREYLERGRAIISKLHGIAIQQAQWRADLAKFDQAIRSLGG